MSDFKVDPSWTDKDSKVDRFRSLYEQKEFLKAYASHTDLRVRDNPKGAIGREDEWESHGNLQRDFLIEQGLKPYHWFLDLGCGTGRLARKIVPYLDERHYTGVDISEEALAHASQLSAEEGWSEWSPEFIQIDGHLDRITRRFDMIWAHSVFTHLPQEQIEVIIGSLNRILSEQGKFLFTYKRGSEPERTGLKQWRYSWAFFEIMAERHGLKATSSEMVWPASQRTGLISR